MLSGALESTDGARRDPPGVPDEPRVSALDFLTRKTPAAIPVTTTAAVETPPPVIPSPNVITVGGPLSEGLGFESQCVHFGHPSAGGCRRSTGDPRLILGKGYRLVILGGYGRTDPLLKQALLSQCYQYGRDGEGGLDIQGQTMRKHQHSIKHEASVDRQQLRDCKNAAQKSIVDFENGDGEAKRLTKLLATFMAEMGTPDMPLKDPGTYYSAYGFAQLVETHVIYLCAQQMKHIRESPYLGIQLDESTDRRRGKHLIVYLSFLRSNTPVTEFFAHLTVEQCDARSLQAVFLTHLESTGLDLERINGISTDGASVMVGSQTGLVACLRARIPHLAGFHCIAHREALAAKDAAEAYPDLDIVDHVVRSLAELLGRSGNFHLRFKELQEVLCETNLELQGIHSVSSTIPVCSFRQLSRGLAVQRLADNLPAAVILLYENDPKAYLLVTSLKFHFMLFFFADVLKELNALNLKFRQRQIFTRACLSTASHVDADDFGDGSNEPSAFFSKHASSEKREVKVTGTDSTGAPTTQEYTLHEQNIKGQKSGPGLDDCITLAKGYVKELLKRLESRMKDLGSLNSAKLFTQGGVPEISLEAAASVFAVAGGSPQSV
ncbi:unnamed protein product [Closterium sp. NIES-53]